VILAQDTPEQPTAAHRNRITAGQEGFRPEMELALPLGERLVDGGPVLAGPGGGVHRRPRPDDVRRGLGHRYRAGRRHRPRPGRDDDDLRAERDDVVRPGPDPVPDVRPKPVDLGGQVSPTRAATRPSSRKARFSVTSCRNTLSVR